MTYKTAPQGKYQIIKQSCGWPEERYTVWFGSKLLGITTIYKEAEHIIQLHFEKKKAAITQQRKTRYENQESSRLNK